MFNTLRARLTITMISIAILPVLVISIFVATQGFTRLRDETATTQQLNVLNAVEANISEYINRHVIALTVLDQTIDFSGLQNDERRSGILSNLLFQDSSFQNLYVLSPNGEATIEVNRYLGGSSIPEEVRSASITADNIYFSPVRFDELTGEPLITIGIPLINLQTGSVNEFILADVRFSPVWEILSTFDFASGQTAYLIDSNNQVVAHPNASVVLAETTFTAPETDGKATGLNNDEVVLGSDTIQFGNQQFTIVVEQNFEESTRLFANLQNFALISDIIIVGLAIIIATIVAQRIVKPINDLNQITEAYGRGDLTQRAKATSSDEIGQLGKSFNTMAKSIQQRETSLREARNDALASKRIADENSRLKSEFLSMMSHELRTPMNAIQGFTGIILKRMAGAEYNEKTKRYLTKIQSNSERLLDLINDFLDLSRIESGRLELAHMPMSPYDMAQKWQDTLSVLAENKGLDFKLVVDPNLPATIYGDEESLSKIVVNLVGNAAKFTEEGSITLSLKKENDNMIVEVNDTGMGIPAHAREYIFEEFRQVDMSTKRVHGGTGLGLSIVQKLVREMNGVVTLESEVGIGSTFIVAVPIETEAGKEPATA